MSDTNVSDTNVSDTALNFRHTKGSDKVLNFGEVEDDKQITFYKDLEYAFPEYKEMYLKFDKTFIDDKKEIVGSRVVINDKTTKKLVKRFYGSVVAKGSSGKIYVSVPYRDFLLKGLSIEQFNTKYQVRLEVVVSDIEETGDVDINSLFSNLEIFLMRDKKNER